MRKLKFASEYKSEKGYPFPDESLPQSKKDEGYFRSCAQAIVSKFINNKCYVPYEATGEDYRTFSELRAYRYGKNSPNKYKNYLAGSINKDTGKRRTTLNMSWDVLQILPQKMDVVMGYLQKIKYEVTTEAVDYQALVGKKTMIAMAKLISDDNMRLMKRATNELAGRQVLPPDDPSVLPGGMQFNSPQEVDMAAQVGVFFLEQEAAIKNLLDKTQYDSGSEVLEDLLKNDLCTLGIAGTRSFTNQNTNIVLYDYCDPDMCMIPWSQYNDFRDMTWAGEVRTITIAQLRKELKIDEKELIKIAKQYSSEDGSGNFYLNLYKHRNNEQFSIDMIDQIQVDVADCRWLGTKSRKITTVRRRNEGNLVINQVDDNYKLTKQQENKGKEIFNYENQTVYKAKLILGTSYVFDFGEDTDIGYTKNESGKMCPVFPYKFVKTGNSSLVERCIGFIDDANLANLKLRNARMKMPAPPNIMIRKSALENVKIDGLKYNPQQLMRLAQDEGFLIVDDQNGFGNQVTSGRAVDTIPTDVIRQLLEWRADVEWSIGMVERVTGVNEIFSAQTPRRETGLGVSNLMLQATNNALTPIIKSYEYLYEQTMRVCANKWQAVALFMDEEQRKRLSINRSLLYLKVGSDLKDFDFDIRIQAGITDEEKAQLLMDITKMRDAARQGGVTGIGEADYLLIYSLIRRGNIRQAQLALAQIAETRKKEAQAEQERLIQLNSQSQLASGQQSSQNKISEMASEGDIELRNKLQEIQAQMQADIVLKRIEAQNQTNQLALQNVWGREQRSA